MRIVAGEFKGRAIATPKGRDTRPTSDRARETVFNILAHAAWSPPLGGARVIDVFAGSGALGLEALSRGAAACLFVETARPARTAIAQNIKQFGIADRARLARDTGTALSPNPGPPYTLAFLDPPYRKGLVAPALASLRAGNWLGEASLVMVETAREEGQASAGDMGLPGVDAGAWDYVQVREAGAARLWFLVPR